MPRPRFDPAHRHGIPENLSRKDDEGIPHLAKVAVPATFGNQRAGQYFCEIDHDFVFRSELDEGPGERLPRAHVSNVAPTDPANLEGDALKGLCKRLSAVSTPETLMWAFWPLDETGAGKAPDGTGIGLVDERSLLGVVVPPIANPLVDRVRNRIGQVGVQDDVLGPRVESR